MKGAGDAGVEPIGGSGVLSRNGGARKCRSALYSSTSSIRKVGSTQQRTTANYAEVPAKLVLQSLYTGHCSSAPTEWTEFCYKNGPLEYVQESTRRGQTS